MNTIEKSGKTVEDAVEAGLKELKLTSSEVDIEVLEYGSPGLFGMFGKLAKVKLTVKKQDDDFDFEMPTLSLDRSPSKPSKPKMPEQKPQQKKTSEKPKADAVKAEKPKQESDKPETQKAEVKPKTIGVQDNVQKAVRDEKPAAEKIAKPRPQAGEDGEKPVVQKRERPPRPPREPRSKSDRPEKAPRPQKPKPANPETDQKKDENRPPMERMTMEDLPMVPFEELTDDGKKAYEFLINTTKLMGVEVEIRIREKEGQLQIQMSGDTLGILIGRRGETLDALQYLTSLKVNKGRDEYMRVTLDTEHYRAKREEALRRLAERMANRARKTGRRVALEPMNPYERRVLHSALQDNEFVTTHSEGEDPYRRVIITLK